MPTRSRLAVATAAISILASACSAGALSSSPARTSSTVAATPIAAAPTPSATVALVPVGVAIQHGRYASRFDPAFTFTAVRGEFDDDRAAFVDYGFGQATDGPEAELFMVPINPVDGSTTPDWSVFIERIRKLAGITTVRTQTVVKAGNRDALQIDIASGSKDVMFTPAGAALGIPAESVVRLIVVRVGVKVVLIAYLHHGDSKAGFPDAVDVFQPFVDSIEWQ